MTNRPRSIGTAAETAVVKTLRANGFPHAERRPLHGSQDWGDIYGTPGIAWEVKAGDQAARAEAADIAKWISQTEAERRNSSSDLGVLVIRRKGKAAADAWWAVIQLNVLLRLGMFEPLLRWPDQTSGPPIWLALADLIPILRAAGYGDPPAELTA